jgi:MscS family membrane protein
MDLNISWIESASAAIGLQPWAVIVFLIVLATLLFDFVQRRLMKHLAQVVQNSKNLWDNALHHAASRPLTLIIWLIGITLAAQAIPVEGEGHILAPGLIIKLRQIGALLAIAWFLVTFVKNIENNIIASALRNERKVDQTTVSALGRVVRITIVVTVGLIALDSLGVNVSGLLAAGGIGGLAVGLAAKDMLANFFGGITVFIDRPFSVGDWILLKERGIEGVVEQIGWRQTTIRKFDKRPVYVPNAIFTTAAVENPSRMSHRRINEVIGLRYDDINHMEAITDEVREMLTTHSEIDEKQTLMVQFDAFNASSVDFFIYCMTHTVDWQHYHEIKQDVLLKIQLIIGRNGAEIAYPTRNLKVKMSPEMAGLETLNEDLVKDTTLATREST